MRIIIDTERETRSGLLAAIRVLRSLLQKSEGEAGGTAAELPKAQSAREDENEAKKSKAEEGFINIFAGELPAVKKEEDGLSEDDFDFETY